LANGASIIMAISIPRTEKTENINEPYIGPRPFGTGLEDQKRFFGRDYETDEIISLIVAHNLVLVYAQSGAGKTSIFNAQILPTIEKQGFEILPTTRVKITSTIPIESSSLDNNNAPGSGVHNIYMFNALHRMKSDVDPHLLLNESLTQFLKKYFPIKKDKRGRSKPQIIVFDQFEELFTLSAKNYHKQRKNFFEQIVEALDDNPVLRVVFVMREEYIAQLDPFTDLLPERLRYRFRLERLKKDAALMAIRRPLIETGIYNKEFENDINNIISNLEDEGKFVEPIHLQVVCQRWWLERLSTKKNTDEEVFKDNIADVDKALEEFYIDAIHDAAKQTGISEKDIREWCES
jgi:hypothetical protein